MNYDCAVKGENISKKFKTFTLDIPDLRVPKGFATALIGENGAGKSTFINLILRLYTPCRGQILINNINIDNINIHSYRENICTVLQTDDLFKGTIEDNITVYKRYNLPMELLNLNLFSFINKYHSGIDTKIESKSSGVSGGEKQKIAL